MKLNEVYKNSGLGKWFHKQSATKEPGWDRYNSSGKRVGKCGDAKEGEAYSACLSKQKAKKLGKEGVASFVERKRSAQTKAGRGKKGTGEKGKKPIFVETGAAKKKKVEEQMNYKNKFITEITDEELDALHQEVMQNAQNARNMQANLMDFIRSKGENLRRLEAQRSQNQQFKKDLAAKTAQTVSDINTRKINPGTPEWDRMEQQTQNMSSGIAPSTAQYRNPNMTPERLGSLPGESVGRLRAQMRQSEQVKAQSAAKTAQTVNDINTKKINPGTPEWDKMEQETADMSKGIRPAKIQLSQAGIDTTKNLLSNVFNLAEECGCEHNKERSLVDKIKNKVKKKYLKETPSIVKSKSTCRVTECMDFTELDLSRFKGKKTLIETAEGDWYGTLGVFKGNTALFHGETVHKIIEPSEVVKVVCEDTKVLILEKNKPNDPEKWSACKSAAKSKFDVYPSAYANSWASKCYKKKGGTWRSVKEQTDLDLELLNETIKHKDGKWVVMNKDETKVLGTHPSKTKALAQLRAIEASKARHGMNENTSILLRDRLRDLFFAPNIAEEVVNKDHKGSMTPAELKKRDEIAAQLRKRGNIKRIKTDERLDSQEEAEYRTATFKVLAMRHGKGKTKKTKK